MAAVTVNKNGVRGAVGNIVLKTWTISGATGSTLDTLMKGLQFVDYQRTTAAGSASQITTITISGSVLTINASGTMVQEVIAVWGVAG